MEKDRKVAIVDYNLGNLFSVFQACTSLGYDTTITNKKDDVINADYLILPGVGAFGDAINTLRQLDLVEPMKDFIASGKPFLGVCLGLQLLFTESEEFGRHKGLNIIEGVVKKFPTRNEQNNILKVPQIQWNQIFWTDQKRWENSPLENCRNGDFMYFVHSYYVAPSSEQTIASITEYGGITYCSSIISNNIFACQFHPEKSGQHGLDIYKSFFSKHRLSHLKLA
jgi:glutamine amidotransferase